jgi:two-component system, sensor histidine kinase and response regulator
MLELGLDAYLVRPVMRKELFRAIRRVIENANRNGVNATLEEKPPEKKHTQLSDAPKTKILVAEDSPDNRLVISVYLRNEPCQVDFAENGKAAIEKFTSHQYDLVFMDIQMPVIDGLTATRTIREWETNHGLASTPIIALTASIPRHNTGGDLVVPLETPCRYSRPA